MEAGALPLPKRARFSRSSLWHQRYTFAMSDAPSQPSLPPFLTREQIHRRVAEMGAEISKDFAGQNIVLVGVLKGAAIFLADLARAITVDCTFDFVAVSSYGKSSSSSGAVRLIKDLDQSIEERNVLLVEDILDTGLTLDYLRTMLLQRRPTALKMAAFLDKPSRRLLPMQADYVGFTMPNHFVVGYGMDYAEQYRNLPDVCFLPPHAQE